MTMEEVFGEPISVYSAEQAVADGEQIVIGTTGKLRVTIGLAGELATRYELRHDGKIVDRPHGITAGGREAIYPTNSKALAALHAVQGQSWDYAMKHGGWSITEGRELDAERLQAAVSSVVSEYLAMAYCVPKRAASAPEEADASLAYYLYDVHAGAMATEHQRDDHHEVRIWAVGPGDGSLVLMRPEDY